MVVAACCGAACGGVARRRRLAGGCCDGDDGGEGLRLAAVVSQGTSADIVAGTAQQAALSATANATVLHAAGRAAEAANRGCRAVRAIRGAWSLRGAHVHTTIGRVYMCCACALRPHMRLWKILL